MYNRSNILNAMPRYHLIANRIYCFNMGIKKFRFIIYFKGIFLNKFSQKNHFYLLPGLCLLALISFGFFCYDNDPFDNNDLPDFSYQYPSIFPPHIDQVVFIDTLNQSNKLSSILRNSLLARSPPV